VGTMARFLVGLTVVAFLIMALLLADALVTWLSGYPQWRP